MGNEREGEREEGDVIGAGGEQWIQDRGDKPGGGHMTGDMKKEHDTMQVQVAKHTQRQM